MPVQNALPRSETDSESTNNELANIPNLIPLNSDVTLAKSKVEQLTEELSEKANALELRIDSLEPQQENLSLATEDISRQIADLFDITKLLKDKIGELEPEHHHLTVVTDELQDELENQINRIKDIESRLGSLEPRSEQLEIATKKLGEMSNRVVSKINQLDSQIQILEPNQQQLFEKTAELNNRTELLEESSTDLTDSVKRTQIVFSVLFFLLVVGVVAISVKGFGFVEQKWLGLQELFVEQLNVQDQKIAENQAKQTQLLERLSRVQQQIENNASVSAELQGEYETLSAEIQALSNKVAQLSERAKQSKQAKIVPGKIQIHDSHWILAQNSGHYSIQLLGVYDQQALMEYANKHQQDLSLPVAWMKTQYAGKDWYVLQYGSFVSFKEALAVLKQLPETLKGARPWIRSYQNLQDGIREIRAKLDVRDVLNKKI